jgi:hypothetical protein
VLAEVSIDSLKGYVFRLQLCLLLAAQTSGADNYRSFKGAVLASSFVHAIFTVIQHPFRIELSDNLVISGFACL